jgi:hypothetical protein
MRWSLLEHGGSGIPIGDRANDKPRFRQLLTQGLNRSDIPIDDQYLFIGFGGEHISHRIKGGKLYSWLTVL